MHYKILNKISDFSNYMDRTREFRHQKQIIKDKLEVINKVQWSDSQTKEYNEFWLKNYGYIPAVEHCKYFEAINGIYNYKYIPRALYARVIEPRMNLPKICSTFELKSLQETLFRGINDLRVPSNYLSCTDGYYCTNDSLVTKKTAIKEISDIGMSLIKPSYYTSSGKKVRILNLNNGVDSISGENIDDIFSSYGKYFVIQELVIPSREIRKLSLKSVNTFRIVTFIMDGTVHCGPVAFRIGVGQSITDNESSGGYATGVHSDGTLYSKAFSYENDKFDKFMEFEKHPDTGTVLDGFYIGDIEKIKEVACRAHSRIPNLGVLSWDFTLDENDNVTFIELNTMYCGIDLNQVATGESLFGDYTEQMLKSFFKAKKIGL